MRILFVVNNAAFFCSHRLPIAMAAREAGHQVALVTGGAGSATMEADALRLLSEVGIPHTVVAFTSKGTNPLQELIGLIGIVNTMRRWDPDVVHCASPKGLLYGGLAARLSGRGGLVLAVSGMGTLFTPGGTVARKLMRKAYTFAVRLAYGHPNRRVIVQNQDDRAALIDAGFANQAHVTLIPGSGVLLSRYLALGIEQREDIVLLPARVLRDKGVLEFIEAARVLRAEGCLWRFVLAGAADYANPTAVSEAQIRAWESAGLVEWWGHCTDMPTVLGRVRIVCLPSYREGMPKALLEAAAAGCAVLTTDAVGCREAVLPGITGDLVPVADAPALTRALRRLIADPVRCVAYGTAGRQLARERFDLNAVVRQTLTIYHELSDS
jgi:glycosyltransferase involved in cell wall biosynthesis